MKHASFKDFGMFGSMLTGLELSLQLERKDTLRYHCVCQTPCRKI